MYPAAEPLRLMPYNRPTGIMIYVNDVTRMQPRAGARRLPPGLPEIAGQGGEINTNAGGRGGPPAPDRNTL